MAEDKQTITFKDKCGLKIKDQQDCLHFPFPQIFDYTACDVYRSTFKSAGVRNDVVPTKDFQYSDTLVASSITEMELL